MVGERTPYTRIIPMFTQLFIPRLPRRQRRGLSTPLLLMGVMSALLFIVMVIDLAQLSLQRRQMQNAADATARAAVPELMDRRWLYLGGPNDHAKIAMLEQMPGRQTAAAIAQAQQFARNNRVAEQVVELPADGVFVGYVDDPTSANPVMHPPGEHRACNSIGIEMTRSKLGGNPPILWLARQTGLDEIDIVVRSQACVDTRIHGFQALEHVHVPIVPLGLFKHPEEGETAAQSGGGNPGDGSSDDLPAQLWWAKGPKDMFTVHPVTGEVLRRPDGIYEMTFRLPADPGPQGGGSGSDEGNGQARRCAMIGFRSLHLSVEQFARLAIEGAGQHDLSAFGGRLTLGDDPPALVPADFALPPREASALCQLFFSRELLGRARIWPVVADCSSAVGAPTVGIIGFVAGCVVDCVMDRDGSLLVVIQPCVMQTPTALTGEVAQRNPWIGKLLLVR